MKDCEILHTGATACLKPVHAIDAVLQDEHAPVVAAYAARVADIAALFALAEPIDRALPIDDKVPPVAQNNFGGSFQDDAEALYFPFIRQPTTKTA